jgi:UDP:flavonoid glycosyltransferase YjiC (YdhE family)
MGVHITIIAVGTRGDVQPMIALAAGLRKAGHSVLFATEMTYLNWAHRAGLGLWRLSGDSETFNSGRGGKLFRDTIEKPATRYMRFWRVHVAPAVRYHLREIVAPCEHADLVICQPWFGVGPSLAQKFRIPAVVAGIFPVPQLPTGAFPFPLYASPSDMTEDARLKSWRRAIPVTRAGHGVVQEWRREMLGLPEQSFAESLAAMQKLPHILGYSPSVLPKPCDWGAQAAVTGYWFGAQTRSYRPPPEVKRFLAAGDPPVVVGFGSHVGRNGAQLTQLVLAALATTGRRGILITGWGGLGAAELPENVICARELPFDWLLRRASVLVHHGGAGTTAIALRSGIPQVITPFGWDQTFWGRRCAELGVSAEPIANKEITSEQLAAAIDRMAGGADVRARARRLAKEIAAESGVANAVAAVETVAAVERVHR